MWPACQCHGKDEHVQNEVHALLICQDHRVCVLRKHFSFLFTPFFNPYPYPYTFFWGLFSSPTLFAATGQQPTCSWFPFSAEQETLSFFFLSLWIYLWLAETSQQPVSQTTWLKVTPHCNHSYYGFNCGWPRPVSSRSAKQPGWRSSPIIIIVKSGTCTRKRKQMLVPT